MLVEDQDGQKMVVVNPGPGEEPQTIVIPEQVMISLLAVDQIGSANLFCLLQILQCIVVSGWDCLCHRLKGKLLLFLKLCKTSVSSKIVCDHHSNRKIFQDGAETIVPQQSAALESILRVRLKTF